MAKREDFVYRIMKPATAVRFLLRKAVKKCQPLSRNWCHRRSQKYPTFSKVEPDAIDIFDVLIHQHIYLRTETFHLQIGGYLCPIRNRWTTPGANPTTFEFTTTTPAL
jgi:hypothetical protein